MAVNAYTVQGGAEKRKRTDDDVDDTASDLFCTPTPRTRAKSEVWENGNDFIANQFDSDEECFDRVADDGGEYSEAREPFPKHGAYDKDISLIKDALTALAEQADNFLNRTQCSSKDVHKLRAKTREVASIPELKPKMIGLLGDAGMGKSSLLNTIADVSRLAKAIDTGKSCTFVVTLYQRALPTQRLRYSAKVEFFDVVTIGSILSLALDDWRLYFLEPDEDWTDDQKAYYENRAMTARATFRAIFCDRKDFSSDEAASAWLDHVVSKAMSRDREIAGLTAAVQRKLAVKKQEGDSHHDYFEADDQGDLRDDIDPMLTESYESDQPSLWPFVKQVTIGVRGSRVLDYYSIADLPGISDIHQIRVKATKVHITKCDWLWIVARAGRICTDNVVNGLLQRYARAFRGRVMVIATKSDENVTHALINEYKDLKHSDYTALKASSDLMQSEIKSLEKKKRSHVTSRQKNDLQQQIDVLTDNRKSIENNRWELVVKARNVHNAHVMQREKQRYFPPGMKLNIFSVSNTHYEVHKGEEEAGAFVLSPEATGVPGLRAYTLRSAAPGVLAHLENFISHEFTVFLRGLELWAESSVVKGRPALLKIVQRPQSAIEGALEEYVELVFDEVQIRLVTPLKDNEKRLSAAAVKVLEQTLKPRHWSTLKAFIRRYGTHSTSLLAESWNEMFTSLSTDLLTGAWEPFLQKHDKLSEIIEQQVATGMSNMLKRLNTEPAMSSVAAMSTFEGLVNARVAGIHQQFRQSRYDLNQSFGAILVKATHDSEANYMKKALRQAYKTCQADHGTGIKQRCMGTFGAHLSLEGDRSPFALLAKSLSNAIACAVDKQAASLRTSIEKMFEQVTQDFETMINQKTDDKTEIPVRQALKEFLVTAKPEFERISVWLEEVKARYPVEVRRD